MPALPTINFRIHAYLKCCWLKAHCWWRREISCTRHSGYSEVLLTPRRAPWLWSEAALAPNPLIHSSINAEILKGKLIIDFKNSFALHFSELITFCLSLFLSSVLLMIKLELGRENKWGSKSSESTAARTDRTEKTLPQCGCHEGPDKWRGYVKLNPIFSTPKAIGNHVITLEVLLSILKEGNIKIQQAKVPSY